MFKAPAGRFFAAQAGKKVGQLIHIGVLYNVVAVAVVMLKAGVGVHKLFVTVLELIQRFGVALPEQVLSDKPLFFAINSYTEGLSPAVMEYVLKTTLCPTVGGRTSCDEIGLPVTATGGVVPCGATAVWEE